MLSRVLAALLIFTLSLAVSASPLYYRSPVGLLPSQTLSSPSPTATSETTPTDGTDSYDSDYSSQKKNESETTLDWMYVGNEAFREMKDDIMEQVQDAPKVLFLGCSDSRLSPEILFQTDPGTASTHLNLGNQYQSQDLSSSSAVGYAIQGLKVKHIVILGHYGCKSVEGATDQVSKSKSSAMRKWLQPIADLYTNSKRFEVRRLRALRKGSDLKSTTNATPSGLRALVEENVKASVQNLQNEIKSLLGETAYNETELYGHGLVIDEETGDVQDLNVSFGPPGKELVEPPFDKVPKPRMHIPQGKFEARKKKVPPTSVDGAQVAFSVDS